MGKLKSVKVWTCKVIVPDVDLPPGFDSPPRSAVVNAIESHGIEVLGCTSGWGGNLTKGERIEYGSKAVEAYPDVYFAGAMDAPEDIKH